MFITIKSSYFVAGLQLVKIRDNYKNKCAPIISYMNDWDLEKIKAYCIKKKWEYREVD